MKELIPLFNSFKALLIPLSPFLIVKAIEVVQRVRISYRTKKITPVSPTNWKIILILLITALLHVTAYIYIASPKINVFLATNSRMQTSSEVLGARLRSLFGDDYDTAPKSVTSKSGTWDYDLLVSRLASAEGRALYSIYGTDAYAGCQWCRTDKPDTFFLYLLPTILLPHIINLFPILLVTTTESTSFSLSTPNSRQWFSYTILITGLLIGLEAFTVYKAPRSSDLIDSIKNSPDVSYVYWMYWSRIQVRGWLLASLDSLLAFLIYLSAAGYAFDTGESTAIRTKKVIKQLDNSVNKLRLSILLHTNVISRNKELRDAYEKWGTNTAELDQLIRNAPEIVKARKQAKNRVVPGIGQLETDASTFVGNIFED